MCYAGPAQGGCALAADGQVSHAPVSGSNISVRSVPAFDTRGAIAGSANRWPRLVLVVGFYTAASIVCTFPLILHLADTLAPAPDTLLHSWILGWDIHALTTDPLHLYDANVYFPFPLSLTYSDAMLSGALMVAPIILLTGNAILAHNVLTIASLLLAGVAMYFLARALTGSDPGALVAGCIFAFCAARQAHLEHVNLLQFGWLPLALLYMHKAVDRGRWSDLLLLALFTVCQALASVYLAWMMAIAYVIFVAVELVFRRSSWTIRGMAGVAGALLLAALIVVPVMWPYLRMQRIYEFNWPIDVIGELSAVPSDYLSVVPRNVVYGDILAQFSPGDFPTEHILFPGFAALALALIAVVRRSANVEVVRYGLITLVAFVLSFGPAIQLSRTQAIALPYAVLLQFVPGFAVMRVPARFDFLLMLGLAVLAGFGVARLGALLSRRTSALTSRLVLGGVVALALIELLPRPQSFEPVSVGAAVPPVYGWLRTQDPGAVVAEIPTKGPTGFASFEYEYFSTYHWHPLVNGESGFEPPAAKPVANQLDRFPDPSAVANLRSLGVRYLIAHLDKLDAADRQRLDAADLSQLHLGIAATFGRDVVYELAPLASSASLQDHLQLELPSVVGRAATPYVTATLTNDTPMPVFLGAPEAIGAQIEWNHDGQMGDPRRDVPAFFEPNSTLRLAFPARLSPTLKAADTAQLTVRLTGSVQLEATQSVRIVDLPTSMESTGLAAALGNIRLPKPVRVGTPIPIAVTVRNTGQATWLGDLPDQTVGKGVVGVSVRNWIGPDGTVWPPSAYSTAHLDSNVNPGQSAVVTLQTTTPPEPGRYDLVLDTLSESVAWFADVNGGTQTLVPVDVEP
jgi:hypothetical protein